MLRSELEHAIRAATEIIRQDAVVIIGSQAILGSFTEDELPTEATLSEEVDIAPLKDDDAQSLATELDAAICAWSPTTFVPPSSSPAGQRIISSSGRS